MAGETLSSLMNEDCTNPSHFLDFALRLWSVWGCGQVSNAQRSARDAKLTRYKDPAVIHEDCLRNPTLNDRLLQTILKAWALLVEIELGMGNQSGAII